MDTKVFEIFSRVVYWLI